MNPVLKNRIKSWIFMIFLFTILVSFSFILASSLGGGFVVFIFFAFLSVTYILFSYYYSDRLVLYFSGAKPIEKTKYEYVKKYVEELSKKAGIKIPKVYLIPTRDINAFATGRNKDNAAIAITIGAIEYLTPEELKGVIGHELTHIVNEDVKFDTFATIAVGLISMSINFLFNLLFFSSLYDREGESTASILFLLVVGIISTILATLIRAAISRSREFMADLGSAKLTKHPEWLISALKKIDYYYKHYTPSYVPDKTMQHLFIYNPFKGFLDLLSTHPPIEKRIETLRKFKV